jgi:HEAT repeat protein
VHRLSLSSRKETRIIASLRAIGNSGYSPALAKVVPYLSDPREQLRVDAVRALRAMQAPEVERTLVQKLEDDASTTVRLAAIEAMVDRVPSDILVDGLRRASTVEESHVRHRAVELMIRWVPKRAELRRDILLVAENDAEPKIRELAKASL